MRRTLLDIAVVGLALLQVWQWWPSIDTEFAEPDDTLALFTLIEDLRSQQIAPLHYLESDITITQTELRLATSTLPIPPSELYQHAKDSTVVLVGFDDWGDAAIGTGVILTADGVIATNEHMVTDMTELYVILSDLTTTLVVESVLYSDLGQDLALLQASDHSSLTPITISQTEPDIGDTIYTLGHPELFLYSLTDGIVSGQRTYTEAGGQFLQMTAPVNYGSSGGPVLNQHGHLVGLVSWSLEYEQNIQNVEGLHFAIPTSKITRLFAE